MSEDFDRWWREIGSGISPLSQHDMEQHAERVASMAWERCEYRESMLRGEIDRIRADLAKAIEERDLAQGMFCYERVRRINDLDRSGPKVDRLARLEAAKRGWNCFRQEGR